MVTEEVFRCAHNGYLVNGSILKTSHLVVVCGTTTNVHTAIAATTIVDSVPSCIPQWNGWGPRDYDSSWTYLDYHEVSRRGGN